MNKSRLLGALCTILFSFITVSANATSLSGRLETTPDSGNFLAYYDHEQNITWSANAKQLPPGPFPSGVANWVSANTWVANLGIGGVTGWRLPTTLYVDPSCSDNTSLGTGCTGSEMGYLFNLESISAASPGPFSSVQAGTLGYWSATPIGPNSAYYFDFGTGEQSAAGRNATWRNVWAVHNGDVGASVVPVPAAVWLFGSGLLGLVGMARRKKAA